MYDTYLTVTGNLTADPIRRRTTEGTSMASFRLASTARRWHREREEFVDGDTVFVTVKCWRAMADRVHGELRRGHSVVVTGRLATKEWESDGQRQQRYQIEADAIGPNMAKHEVLVRDRGDERPGWPADRTRAGSTPEAPDTPDTPDLADPGDGAGSRIDASGESAPLSEQDPYAAEGEPALVGA